VSRVSRLEHLFHAAADSNSPIAAFYLIMNVAVGGTNGWFPDGVGSKPWVDSASSAVNDVSSLQLFSSNSHVLFITDSPLLPLLLSSVLQRDRQVVRDLAGGSQDERNGDQEHEDGSFSLLILSYPSLLFFALLIIHSSLLLPFFSGSLADRLRGRL